MIRDSARAVTPAALAELDREPSPNRLADPCERCSFRHAPGPCLVPRVLAPGEEGATRDANPYNALDVKIYPTNEIPGPEMVERPT